MMESRIVLSEAWTKSARGDSGVGCSPDDFLGKGT